MGDTLDSLIPNGLYAQGVSEFSDTHVGSPWLSSFLMLVIFIGMIFLAVSIDSYAFSIVKSAGRGARTAL